MPRACTSASTTSRGSEPGATRCGDRPQRVAGFDDDGLDLRAALGGGKGGPAERRTRLAHHHHETEAECHGDEPTPPVDSGGSVAARRLGRGVVADWGTDGEGDCGGHRDLLRGGGRVDGSGWRPVDAGGTVLTVRWW